VRFRLSSLGNSPDTAHTLPKSPDIGVQTESIVFAQNGLNTVCGDRPVVGMA